MFVLDARYVLHVLSGYRSYRARHQVVWKHSAMRISFHYSIFKGICSLFLLQLNSSPMFSRTPRVWFDLAWRLYLGDTLMKHDVSALTTRERFPSIIPLKTIFNWSWGHPKLFMSTAPWVFLRTETLVYSWYSIWCSRIFQTLDCMFSATASSSKISNGTHKSWWPNDSSRAPGVAYKLPWEDIAKKGISMSEAIFCIVLFHSPQGGFASDLWWRGVQARGGSNEKRRRQSQNQGREMDRTIGETECGLPVGWDRWKKCVR